MGEPLRVFSMANETMQECAVYFPSFFSVYLNIIYWHNFLLHISIIARFRFILVCLGFDFIRLDTKNRSLKMNGRRIHKRTNSKIKCIGETSSGIKRDEASHTSTWIELASATVYQPWESIHKHLSMCACFRWHLYMFHSNDMLHTFEATNSTLLPYKGMYFKPKNVFHPYLANPKTKRLRASVCCNMFGREETL